MKSKYYRDHLRVKNSYLMIHEGILVFNNIIYLPIMNRHVSLLDFFNITVFKYHFQHTFMSNF